MSFLLMGVTIKQFVSRSSLLINLNFLLIRSLALTISQLQILKSLLEEKEALEERLAISEYELCLAQEDIS
ncbi:lisH domain and HEAT repeat-containing protein [Quillaja saponaria]|uniref:LisH domain and HEAT repeat-containing protein n=1 Tax=Quillaja saponaria TaxID=32244 RepID=A0AAD7PY23_QUISA|nr:lisH domain and HEAT repeat-containing protein [Quillaja saponaria]